MATRKKTPRRRTHANTLSLAWSRAQKDHVGHYPGPRADFSLLNLFFFTQRREVDTRPGCEPRVRYEPSLVEELDARGYDLTTLRFSIMLKNGVQAGAWPPGKWASR